MVLLGAAEGGETLEMGPITMETIPVTALAGVEQDKCSAGHFGDILIERVDSVGGRAKVTI